MQVIVTGGAGFVGSHLIELLISKKHTPIIIDNLSSGNYQYIKKFISSKKAQFFNLDIRNINTIMKMKKVDAVIHLAAIASVVESINNPLYVNEVNVDGTLNMLEFCRRKNIKKFIFTSSAAIFGDNDKKINEFTYPMPTTVYGATKLVGENYCKIYSELFNIQTIVLRPFNIYGARQNSDYAGVISKFIQRIKENKSPIIFGDGNQTRDFIHVKDVSIAFEKSLSMTNDTKFNIFNLATGKSTSINKLAKICILLSKKPLVAIHKKSIPGVIEHSYADIRKISKILKFKPSIQLENGLNDLLIDID
jgi:UDP-glucose 4-epimerase